MQTKLLINGQLIDGEGPAQSVFNPALGRVLVEINEASEAQVDAAVRAADAAFDSWSQTPPKERSLLLLKLADAIEALWRRTGRNWNRTTAANRHRRRVERRDPGDCRRVPLLRRRQPLHEAVRRAVNTCRAIPR